MRDSFAKGWLTPAKPGRPLEPLLTLPKVGQDGGQFLERRSPLDSHNRPDTLT